MYIYQPVCLQYHPIALVRACARAGTKPLLKTLKLILCTHQIAFPLSAATARAPNLQLSERCTLALLSHRISKKSRSAESIRISRREKEARNLNYSSRSHQKACFTLDSLKKTLNDPSNLYFIKKIPP